MYTFKGDVEQVNALRRTLIRDLSMYSPSRVLVKTNVTSYTDEYIVHRIGLVPFEQTGEPFATINVVGKNVKGSDILGGPKAIDSNASILHMTETQKLDLEIHFEKDSGSRHARFCRTVAVGMSPISEQMHKITFETLIPGDEDECIREAICELRIKLEKLKARL